jgi:hypothetical protein
MLMRTPNDRECRSNGEPFFPMPYNVVIVCVATTASVFT